jgi:hypothetical protein
VGASLPSETHDEFLELCALSTAGELSEKEQNRLRGHLVDCSACREALRQFESITGQAISAIAAAQEEDLLRIDSGPGWSHANAEERLFDRLALDERPARRASHSPHDAPSALGRVLPIANRSTWRHVWTLHAAGIVLFATLSFCAYWVGIHHGNDKAQIAVPSAPTKSQASPQGQSSLEEQLSDAAHERLIVRRQILERDQALAGLRRQLERQAAEMKRMQEAQTGLESELRSGEADRQDVAAQRTELAQKLEAAQSESQSLQRRLDALNNDSIQGASRADRLEAKLNDLISQLQDREAALNQQKELLAHDRDIRELMGARDLYIAEVYDVAENGATRKPYGRVFYTKGKSLIFYAYDLDQQGIRRAQAFQAWGRCGPDRRQPLNLGIFYEDNASKQRWVLKVNDPKRLAQIDAVFVTVEPQGGSDKPSGKPLLFAYLRVDPNHP